MSIMSNITLFVFSTLILFGCGKQSATASNNKISTFNDSVSYAFGMDVATSLKGLGDSLNIDLVIAGLKANYTGKDIKFTKETADKIRYKFMMAKQADMQKKKENEAKANLEKGKKFLEENKKNKDIITTKSGLQYKVLTMGKGPKPKLTDKVKVNYKGTHLDGKEFDSSYKRGKPVSFPLNNVIKGWQEALQLMPVGSKFRVWIPAELAYGKNGAGQVIGPNETLVFDIELLGIEK